MARFNTSDARVRNGESQKFATGEIITNHKGALAYERTPKSELFLLGVSDFVQDTFYESTQNRQARIDSLIKQVVGQDLEWFKSFVSWLRNDANMRSVSLTMALRGVNAMRELNLEGGRSIVSSALTRADEPGEALAFWHATYGRRLPAAVKRGIADAAVKSYNQISYLRYNSSRNAYKFADVIQLTHPSPKSEEQNSLFKYILDVSYNTSVEIPESLNNIRARKELSQLPIGDRHIFMRKVISGEEGYSSKFNEALARQWEWALSWLGE